MAKKFLERPLRIKPQTGRPDGVEYIELSDNEEVEETPRQNDLQDLGTQDLLGVVQIKKERISLLENTVHKLNSRLGTEILNDDEHSCDGASIGISSKYKRNTDVNTLHYHIDEDFAKKIYFITDVYTYVIYITALQYVKKNLILCISD